MTGIGFERLCAEIVGQTDLLRAVLPAADLATAVPSCPGWNVRQLVRHVGGGHRWAAEIVRTRAQAPLPDTVIRDVDANPGADAAELDAWLAGGARELGDALRAAGPDAGLWTPVPGEDSAAFYARRFAHETAVHRADAVLALGLPFTLGADVAVDAMDEWMELGSVPVMLEYFPERRALLGPGRTIHLHATDTPADARAEWVVDLTGDTLAWRRAHEKSGTGEPASRSDAVAVRGPLTELLLLVYRRRPADGLDVLGDGALLRFWLERVGFG